MATLKTRQPGKRRSKPRKLTAGKDWLDSVKPLDTTNMDAARRKLLRLKKEGKFPFRKLTPREEKQLLDKLVRETDRDQLEAEYRELLRLEKAGKLIPFEKVLEDLGVIRRKKSRKPA